MPRGLLATVGIVLSVTGIAISAGGAYAYAWDRHHNGVIAPGVRIAGVEVGGLRATQATAVLRSKLAALGRPVRLVSGPHVFLVDPNGTGLRVDLGRMVDLAVRKSQDGGLLRRTWHAFWGEPVHVAIPLQAAFSDSALTTYADNVARVVDEPAKSADVKPTTNALRLQPVPEREGVAVNRDALRRELAAALLRFEGPRTLTIPTRTLHPRWTVADLSQRYPAFLLISRETFTLRLFRHLKLAKTYPISVGRAGLETPAGLYHINDRQVNPSWHVPMSAWAGDLAGRIIPPGPSDPIKARWLGFYNGAGIHGTTETWSLGHAASHGCVRMAIPDVEALYPLVPLHTPIYVG
ncbi:MAG TPA: L,D-transpeptidase family protein [Gaiellaceae bacterium]|nr:L,D-transpeptidase family protein [Gaiellaceae bacterium]